MDVVETDRWMMNQLAWLPRFVLSGLSLADMRSQSENCSTRLVGIWWTFLHTLHSFIFFTLIWAYITTFLSGGICSPFTSVLVM
jgi:hypothetical protein